jgi:DNA-binding transcriptional LysR family regulator
MLDLLRRGIKVSHLRFLAALSRTGKISDAANNLGITQPAASRLAAELEAISGTRLYHRFGRGVKLTQAGQSLAYRSTRILQEIADAGRDVDELSQGLSGRVTVGAVTGPAIEFVLPVIRQIRLSFPRISLEVHVGSSDILAPMLFEGRLDFALCRLPPDFDPSAFHQLPQRREPISMVARNGHPLLGPESIKAELLLSQDWVLPPVGAILRSTVERNLKDLKLPFPERVLTTSSFLFTLAMLRQTNAIAPIASAVVEAFSDMPAGAASIVKLPTDLDISVDTYSLLTRANQALTPAAESVFREVMRAVTEPVAAANVVASVDKG